MKREDNKQAFVQGMRRYEQEGVSILIDGNPADEADWDKLFEAREDGRFYMADYIFDEEPLRKEEYAMVCEPPKKYGRQRRLREIHFDLVYNK